MEVTGLSTCVAARFTIKFMKFSNLLRSFCTSIDRLVALTGKMAALLMPVLALIVASEVFSRYVLNKPTVWAFDTSLFLFGYIAALGGAYAQQKKAHINVDILYLQVSHQTRSVFNIVAYVLGIFFLVLIVYTCFGKFEEAIEFDYRRQSEWAPPMFHFWVMGCVAASLFIAQLIKDLIVDVYFLSTGQALLEEVDDGN